MAENEKRSSVVKYHLRQETPMWHFQCRDSGMQKGATLRGSDVKPRFDSFLMRQMEEEKVSWDSFKLSSDHDALNYKIKIIANGEVSEDDIGHKSFFANMGSVDSEHAIMYRDGIDVQIMCFIPQLMDMIQKHIPAFFLLNNFGTRQDKGFGGFVIDERNGEKVNCSVSELIRSYKSSVGYTAYKIDESGCSDSDNPLDNAYTLYQWMKSGINFKNTYKKSLLTTYMLEKGIGGEKRWMKENGIAPKVCNQDGTKVPDDREPEGEVQEYKYIRSVLGVSGVQSWFNGRKKRNGKDDKSSISITSEEIDRFQSPITIKYIKGKLYFIVYDLKGEAFTPLFDKEFSFGDTGKKLRTPSDFDMHDFMKYCTKEVNGKPFELGKISYKFGIQELL